MGHLGYALVSIVPTRSRYSYFLHTFVNPAYSKHLLNIALATNVDKSTLWIVRKYLSVDCQNTLTKFLSPSTYEKVTSSVLTSEKEEVVIADRLVFAKKRKFWQADCREKLVTFFRDLKNDLRVSTVMAKQKAVKRVLMNVQQSSWQVIRVVKECLLCLERPWSILRSVQCWKERQKEKTKIT